MSHTPYLDINAYDELVRELVSMPSEQGSPVTAQIKKMFHMPGWYGTSKMRTDEGYISKQVKAFPTDTDDLSTPWTIEVSWQHRDCDGLYDGGHSFNIEFDGLDENGNAKVCRTEQDTARTRDQTAEAAGY